MPSISSGIIGIVIVLLRMYRICIYSCRQIGSISFVATGFHGVHVLIGISFLVIHSILIKRHFFRKKASVEI